MTACPYRTGARFDLACTAGAVRHAGPHTWPAEHYARCWWALTSRAGRTRCTVKPNGHDGPHKYEEVQS
jgi:hypothetical protein